MTKFTASALTSGYPRPVRFHSKHIYHTHTFYKHKLSDFKSKKTKKKCTQLKPACFGSLSLAVVKYCSTAVDCQV